jgi:hypothetical protein
MFIPGGHAHDNLFSFFSWSGNKVSYVQSWRLQENDCVCCLRLASWVMLRSTGRR